ncbi:MAG TPA: hypothetical protein VGL91_11325 [Acidobacteriota bacterium]
MRAALAIFIGGLLVRLWLVWLSPAIYGGDTILRLVHRDRILLAYQMPLFQFLIYAVSWLSRDPLWVRVAVSLMGALAGVFFYLLAREILPLPAAVIAAVLFLCNPYLLHFSVVPYQEIAMLLLLLAGVYFYWRGRLTAASLLIAAACLTRYEAWVVALVCALDFALKPHFARDSSSEGSLAYARGSDLFFASSVRCIKAVLLFLWAPLLWILLWRGLSPQGTFVLVGAWSFARLYRLISVSRAVASGLGWLLIPFFVLGLAVSFTDLWKSDGKAEILNRRRMALFVLSLGVLFSLGIMFSAHGIEPDPERWVTFREGHLPLAVALLFAGSGIHRAIFWSRRKTIAACVLTVIASGYSLVRARQWVERSATQPALQLDLQAARLIQPYLKRGERVAVFAAPLPEIEIQKYLDQVRRTGGMEGLTRAKEILRSLDPGPEDYQRLLAYTGAERRLLLRGSEIGRSETPAVILVFSDAPAGEWEAIKPLLARGYAPPSLLHADSRSVSVYQRRQ